MDKLMKVKKVYSFWGKFPFLYYLQDFITFIGRPGFIRREAVKSLGLKKGDKVIEVACGNGRNFAYIMETIGQEGWLVGFDYSQEMLAAAERLCRKKGWKNITLIRGDAAELNVNEKDFDGAISILGISAIPEWEKALLRCKDVLRVGGKLVICDARPFQGFLKFINPAIKAIYSRFAAWDPNKNIPEKMREIFGNVQIETYNKNTFFIARAAR